MRREDLTRDGMPRAECLVRECRRRRIELDPGFRELFRVLERGPAAAPHLFRAAVLARRSEGSFKRDFKALTDRSWTRFRVAWEMEAAAHLLRLDPAPSVKEVRNAVGFHSDGSFSDAFLAYWGMRPREYRRSRGGAAS